MRTLKDFLHDIKSLNASISFDEVGKMAGGYLSLGGNSILAFGETNIAACSGESGANNCSGNCTHGCTTSVPTSSK